MINDTTPPKPQNMSTGSCSKPPVSSNPLVASDTLRRTLTAVASQLRGDDNGELRAWLDTALETGRTGGAGHGRPGPT